MIVLRRPHGFRLLFVMRGSILPRIAPALAVCTALALIVTVSRGTFAQWRLTLTTVPFSLIGLALAIFLGFRNSAAYDRYWEARKLWGDLLHRSRSFARQLQSLVALPPPSSLLPEGGEDPRRRMTLRIIAFAHALRHWLRGTDASADMARLLPPREAQECAGSRLATEFILRATGRDLGALVREGQLHPQLAASIDAGLSALAAVAAGCERIKTTPIPFAYTLLLHRTAWLYCFLLPFGLVDTIGYATPVVVAVVAYTFFGLDALGDEIEDPFGLADHHLPLDALCRTVEINLLEATGASELPEPLLPVRDQLT
jgi:ion channel-forming bestrophin family protein